MARLERDLLPPGRFEPLDVVRGDDGPAGDAVDEHAVGHGKRDLVALAQPVDFRQWSPVRRAVAGDVDELALAGHVRLRIAPGALRQRRAVGALDDDGLETEARHGEASHGVPSLELLPVALGGAPDAPQLVAWVATVDGCGVASLLADVRGLEAFLLMRGVEGGERVLPLPHGERPGGREQPCRCEGGSRDAERQPHRCQEARREAIAVPTAPRAGRASADGYGA